jgi:serine/threonine protein kinase
MSDIPGYHSLNKIYESKRTSVYRAIRSKDNLPVILKLLNSNYPSEKNLQNTNLNMNLLPLKFKWCNKISGTSAI